MTAARDARFPLVDALRAIAALAVFGVHLPFWATMSDGNVLKPYGLQLSVGVSIFFLISGFLLYRPFAVARRTGAPAPPVVPYAIRRAFRIIPAYWVALPFVVLLVSASGEAETAADVFTPRGVVTYFGFLQVYGHATSLGGISAAWSLCAEAAFYVLLPAVAWGIRRIPARDDGSFLRTELLALGGLCLVGWIWIAAFASGAHTDPRALVDVTRLPLWPYLLPSYLDQFALGMALAAVSVAIADRPEAPRPVRLIDRSPWLPWLGAALAFVALGHVTRWATSDGGRFALAHALQGLVALGLLLPAVFGRTENGWVRRVLAHRALVWTGLVSYSFYLWHAAILRVLSRTVLDRTPVLYVAVGLALSLLVAGASFYAVERPALRVGRRLSRRRNAQDADVRMRALEHETSGVPPG